MLGWQGGRPATPKGFTAQGKESHSLSFSFWTDTPKKLFGHIWAVLEEGGRKIELGGKEEESEISFGKGGKEGKRSLFTVSSLAP